MITKEIKNKLLPAVRVSQTELDIIKKAALKDCRSLSSYILSHVIKNAREDLR